MVSAICPNCHVLLVEANSNSYANLTASDQEAVQLGATEVSNSWAGEEFSGETSFDHAFDHPGVPITAAGGDWGYDDRRLGGSEPNYPAASPYVISVGGTVLAPAAGARGWSESAWEYSGSGCSFYEPKPSFQKDGGCAGRAANDVAAVAQDLSVYDTSHPPGTSLPAWITVGGTSASTPIIAGVEALSEPAERSLGPAAFYRSAGSLHDIGSGSDGVCPEFYLCEAGGGYDGPTGNGTPDGPLSLSGAPLAADLSVSGGGTGMGSIASMPAGIDCVSSCSAEFATGSSVTLTATPSEGSDFTGWQGACSGAGSCTVSLAAGAAVRAVFQAPGTPGGWTVAGLGSPGGLQPLGSETGGGESFFNVSLSAAGNERAETVYDEPRDWCEYATSYTGGITLEHLSSAGWVPEGQLTAPQETAEASGRWANCGGFGEVTKLSGDGDTLLVSQMTAGGGGSNERCAAFIYRRGAEGWGLEATLFPPGVGPGGTSEGRADRSVSREPYPMTAPSRR